MRTSLFFILVFISSSSFGVVFNGDNRLSYYEFPEKVKEVAVSSVSLIPKTKLKRVGEFYQVAAESLIEIFGFCEDAKFSNEPQGANCSGALITPNHILTAAHCISETPGRTMKDYYVVFNYKKLSKEQTDFLIAGKDVFTMVEEIHHDFDMKTTFNDIAIYKLNQTSHYKPAQLDFSELAVGELVYMLGHPLGVSLKLSTHSKITSINSLPNSFRHQLDTFSVNSGSPIFNSSHRIVGILARGTGPNYEKAGRDCNDWTIGDSSKDFGAGNMLNSIQKIFETL